MSSESKTTDYPHFEFGSVDELCQLIWEKTKGWDTRWYRGLKAPSHTLLPKLFRSPALEKREGYIAVEFRRRARSHLPSIRTAFEWLCAMQHFGFPTRLLDWTEGLPVALYFTVRPIGLDALAPTIWVLDPFVFYATVRKAEPSVIPIGTDPAIIANADIAFGDNSTNTDAQTTTYPMPVVPDFLFNRLAVQNGAFTIHGTSIVPLESFIPIEKRHCLLKFVAARDRFSKVTSSIDLLIPSSDSVFPDLEGLKDYIV